MGAEVMVEGSPSDPIARLEHNTERPALTSCRAALRPASPAPITATSTVLAGWPLASARSGRDRPAPASPAAAAPEADSAANRRRLSRFSSGVDPSSDRRSESYAHDSLAASVELGAVPLNV